MGRNQLFRFSSLALEPVSRKKLNFGTSYSASKFLSSNRNSAAHVIGFLIQLGLAEVISRFAAPGAEAHPDAYSPSIPRFINCGGAHAATNKDCSQNQREIRLKNFKSVNNHTIREARCQFSDNGSTTSQSFAKVAFIPFPSDGIIKVDVEAALQDVTTQFTTMFQLFVIEIRQTVLGLAVTLIQRMQTICKELQTKPISKSPLVSLSKPPAQKPKKLRPSYPTH